MNKDDSRMGGSLVYVIVLITFLGILSTGFLHMTEYSRRSVKNSRALIEARTTARSLHQSFSESVSGGTSEAMNTLWTCFAEDCETVREEYEALAGDGEAEDGEGWDDSAGDGEDRGEEAGDGESEDDPGGGAGDTAVPWEAFLRERLGEKAYVIKGRTGLTERVSVSITLTALPLQGRATVSTTAACSGYRISMNADILFDNMEGEMLDLGEGLSISRQGSGVYRYYGESVILEDPDTSQ